MVSTELPRRGEVWLVALGAVRPGEPGKTRPAVVVSSDHLDLDDPADLIVVVPISSSRAPSALRVEVGSEAGLDRPSRVVCRAVRSVAVSRLARRLGRLQAHEFDDLETALSMILALDGIPPS